MQIPERTVSGERPQGRMGLVYSGSWRRSVYMKPRSVFLKLDSLIPRILKWLFFFLYFFLLLLLLFFFNIFTMRL